MIRSPTAIAGSSVLSICLLTALATASLAAATAEDTWTPLTAMAVANPMDHGAKGDGTSNDLAALQATVDALPAAGGIVYLPEGRTFRKDGLWTIARSHIKVWSENRKAEIFADVSAGTRRQSILFQSAAWCGLFGLKQRSNATFRSTYLEDCQFAFNACTGIEICGTEISGSQATGMFFYGSSAQIYVEGNYIHHTYADHIHHTDKANHSWCWGNWILNASPSDGDDGIAAVTYGTGTARCSDMEWWGNTHLGSQHGRGYAVIGGDRISIHDNWAIGTGMAGLIVASEPGYDSAGSSDIQLKRNHLYRCVNQTGTGHPGILLSGLNGTAGAITGVTLADNVVVATQTGQAFRNEGSPLPGIVSDTGLSTSSASLPSPIPDSSSVTLADTTILRTRDVSFVASTYRQGLYRIQVKRSSTGAFLQRFEYLVTGAVADVASWTDARVAAGDYLARKATVGSTSYALLLAGSPLAISETLAGVPFATVRSGDQDGSLSWLWQLMDDSRPPVISAIATSGITASGATISWATNEAAIGQIAYGTTASLGSLSAAEGASTTAHGIALGGLQANTTYHFRVRSIDASGNLGTSGDGVFTTASAATAPVATAQSLATPEDTAKAITLAGTDANGAALTFAIASQPQHGSVALAGAVATYTPAADYNGSDGFAFTVSNGALTSVAATISITVTAVNDTPTIAALAPRSTAPGVAIPVAIVLGDVDSSADSLVLTATSSAAAVVPASGLAFSGTGANRTLTVTPAVATGTTTITVRVSDGAAQTSASFDLTVAGPQVGSGSGLAATYYNQPEFIGRVVQRVDPVIDFNWGAAAPASGIGTDNWCVRWTGEVQAQYGQTYSFSATADDGVRLWVDGRLLIDAWKAQAATEYTASLALNAGQRYAVVMEYYERTGNAVARLAWSSPSTPKQIIPRTQLYPLALPAAWTAQDVGTVGAAGSTSAGHGVFTVTGSGADIWGRADAFQFASRSVTGDVRITARVASQSRSDAWAKAGVMIRETAAAGSRHAFTCETPDNGVAFQRRTSGDGVSSHTAGPRVAAPYWVRLERVGNAFIGSCSADGATWTEIRRETIAMGASVMVGLAVTAHADSNLCTATFTDVEILSASTTSN